MAKTFDCPSCGAPIENQGDLKTIKCKYCGETVIVPEELRDHPKRTRTTSAPQNMNPLADRTTRTIQNTTHKIVTIVVIVAIVSVILPLIFSIVPLGIGLLALLASSSHSSANKSPILPLLAPINTAAFRLERPVIFAPDTGTTTPDFLALIQQDSSDSYQFAMVNGTKHNTVWQSQDLGKNGSDARAFFFEKQVLMVNESTLTALGRASGKTLWQTSLENDLANYCTVCLVESGTSVLVLLKDGTVQALSASTGKQIWNKTLNSTRNDIFLANGQPAVEDNDENNRNIFEIFDPLTGKITRQIQPRCPAKNPGQYFGGYELAPDGKSMVIFYENCLQTISLPDGQVTTEVVQQGSGDANSAWPYAWMATKYMVTRDSIFYSMESQVTPLNVMSLANGNPRQLISDNKYYLTPVLTSGDVLVIEAAPSFDSKTVEYWGINVTSGQRLWKYALTGQTDLNYQDARVTSNGSIFVIQCRQDANCSWANVDSQTGVGSHSGSAPGGFSIDPAWYRDTLYLGDEGKLIVLNTLTGQQVFQWP
jgi:DNA-directed RNA polymerase subunit RPC12/RpoP